MKLKYGRVVPRKTTEDNESRETLVSRERLEIKRRVDNCLKKSAAILLYGARFWLHPKPFPASPRKSELGLWASGGGGTCLLGVRLWRTALRGRGVVFSEMTPFIQVKSVVPLVSNKV